MALVNPNIAMSFRQPDIQAPNALAQFAQIQQIQGGQQAQELARFQLGAAQRAEATQNTLANAYSQSVDPTTGAINYNKLTGLLAAGGGGSQIPAIEKTRRDLENAAIEQQTKSTKLLTDKLALLPEAYKRADTPEAYLQLHQSVHADPVIGPWLNSVGATPEKGLATLQNAVQTGKFDDLRLKSMQSVSQILDSMKPQVVAPGSTLLQGGKAVYTAPFAPEKPPAPPSAVAEYTFAKTPDGGNFKGSFQDFITARAAAGRAPAQPRAEQPLEKVIDPDTGKIVFASREEALRRRMTPATAMESLPPKEIQKREAAFPQATSAVKGIEAKATGFIKDLEELRDHPGLSSITGIAAGRLPGITAEGRAAQAIYDKIVAKGGFQALQEMRDASKTGGALGNVSNQEGTQLKASFAAVDRRQDANDVKKAINNAIIDIERTTARMREAYESTYSYKSGGGTAAPASSTGVDASNPLLK